MLTSNSPKSSLHTSRHAGIPGNRIHVFCFVCLLVFLVGLSSVFILSPQWKSSQTPSLSDGETSECVIDPGKGTILSTGTKNCWILHGVDERVRQVRIRVLQIPETTDVNPSRCSILYDTGTGMNPQNTVWSFLHKGDNYFRIPKSPYVQDLHIAFTDREGDLIQIEEIEINPSCPASLYLFTTAVALITGYLLLLLLPCISSPVAGFSSSILYPVSAAILTAGAFYCAWTMSFSLSPIFIFFPVSLTSVSLFFLCRRLDREALVRNQYIVPVEFGKKEEGFFIIFLLAAIFFFYFLWAMITPLNGAPDETMRYRVVEYIFKYHRIPRGDDPAAISPAWGFSYSYYPCISYVFSALLQALVSLFTKDAFILLMAARMISILCCVLTVWISWLTAKALIPDGPARFAVPVIVGFLPQFAFTAVYVNNNAFAILTGALSIHCWVRGNRSKWNALDCIYLGIATGLCALSYYVSYGYILLSIFFFIYSARKSGLSGKVVRNRFLFISAITLLVCGWWFIRNAILYNGDILGFTSAHKTALLYGDPKLISSSNPSPMEAGQSIFYMLFKRPWIRKSVLSFIGNFFWMNLPLYKGQYNAYLLFYFTGILGTASAVFKKVLSTKKAIYCVLFLSFLFPVIISAAFSYISDYQAQGRYFLPGLPPLSILLAIGFSTILSIFIRGGRKLCTSLLPFRRIQTQQGKKGLSPVTTQKAGSCIGICFLCAFYMILSMYVFFSPVIPFYC